MDVKAQKKEGEKIEQLAPSFEDPVFRMVCVVLA
jgi:hypothetical protein